MKRQQQKHSRRKPDWLKVKTPIGSSYSSVYKMLKEKHVNTICISGKCPNIGECWSKKTATYMILGDICSRACHFCNVKTGRGAPPDKAEPGNIAEAVKESGMKHIVLTSVDRDDLADLGAAHWINVIRAVKASTPEVTIEALIPDFQGNTGLIEQLTLSGAEIISHNLETVQSLTPEVRSAANYKRSLAVIQQIAGSQAKAKSGIMVGLGETDAQVYETMDDLLNAGCKIMTIGQYLQPTPKHLEVKRYVTPGQFREYERTGLEKGFRHVESAPLVRSSYHAHKHLS
ncbi:MAG: lipoyl synthase [Bacteroidales bacterium]